MRPVAVIGGGISGLGAAYELAKAGVHVVLYEKEDCLGGHSKTINFDGLDLDLGFMSFNRVTFPNLTELFDSLGLDVEASEMSLSVSLDEGRECEWGSRNGMKSLFAQISNAMKPSFWKMLQEINKFENDAITYLNKLDENSDMDRTETIGHFIKSRGYSEFFQKAYLVPMCASLWSCSPDKMMNFSAFSVLSFCRNQHLLLISGLPQWLTLRGRSRCYVNKLKEELEIRGSQIKTSCKVQFVSTSDTGCVLYCQDGSQDVYDGCILAVPATVAIEILGNEATHAEMRVLGAFHYVYSDVVLHHDKNFMPRKPAAWSALNFVGNADDEFCLTHWLNPLQNISGPTLPFFMTLNPPHSPSNILLRWSTSHLVPSVAATKASLELDSIQGKRGIWFCATNHGYGYHEEGLKAGMIAAHAMLSRSFNVLVNPKQMVPSWTESAARHVVIRFFKQFISAGCLTLLEDGGTVLTFDGSDKRCTWKSTLRVHKPQFYWKVATEGDLAFADAFINGDISAVDKNEGLQNFFMIFVANAYLYPSSSVNQKSGWHKPMPLTAWIASAKYYYNHISRRNSLITARQNISSHYDISNEVFSLFMGESMMYSCAIFESENEDLEVAQLRKIHMLIEMARVEKQHELLELGCGWGTLAIEAVKKTGCRYTGITVSEEQLKFCHERVNEARIEDQISFILCDYRQLPTTRKYDRIIACELLEHVGDEYYEDFFRCCDSLLADNGVLVLQFSSMPDPYYVAHKKHSDFMREYIFPGGCLPSLGRLTSAMTAASTLCMEDVKNIGKHFYQTIRWWRKNLLDHKSEILSLGFDDKFIRTYEYYFDYCAAGFKTRTLADYQIVLSRPGNLVAFGDP